MPRLSSALAVIILTNGLISGAAKSQPVVVIDAVANQRERTELQALMDASQAVLASPEFTANLHSLGTTTQVYRDGGKNQPRLTTVQGLLDMLAGNGGFRFVPTAVALSGGENFFGGLAGWIGATETDGTQAGSLTLYRGDMARWRSQNVVERSCAVNTIAHELSHTLSSHQARFWQVLLDYNRFDAPAGTPAASYLIGTVAQCTWLQQQNRITAAGFAQCVAVFGTRHFNNRRCDAFAANQNVEDRVGLPAEATDSELDTRP